MSKLKTNTINLEDILEAVNNLPSVESGSQRLEAYTITFPAQCLGGEEIYYTDENGDHQCLTRQGYKVDIIRVVKNSMVLATMGLWGNNTTYIPDNAAHMQSVNDRYFFGDAFIIKGDINFSYSDDAPV